jgi:hypothetical protein
MRLLQVTYMRLPQASASPLLQTLKVQGWPYGPFGGICLDHQGLQLLVHCFPGLRDLRLGAAVEQHADLSPLVQLQQLTALTVSFDLDAKTAQGLAVLTGLRRLTIYTACLPAVALLWLAKLQNLDQLDIYAGQCSLLRRGFEEVSEELLKHLERDHSMLRLETSPVSCLVQRQMYTFICSPCSSCGYAAGVTRSVCIRHTHLGVCPVEDW